MTKYHRIKKLTCKSDRNSLSYRYIYTKYCEICIVQINKNAHNIKTIILRHQMAIIQDKNQINHNHVNRYRNICIIGVHTTKHAKIKLTSSILKSVKYKYILCSIKFHRFINYTCPYKVFNLLYHINQNC